MKLTVGQVDRWTVVGALALTVILSTCLPVHLSAQFTQFGQNKVQYRDLEWKVAKGKHVDLYFYPEEAALVPTVLQWAEESYDSLALKFGWEITTRIPLIVYASHSDFEQTNVLPFVPPEGILGVTDFLKHRVTLPFRGNFAEFRSTLRHEMVHVFQLAMQVENYARTLRDPAPIIPLWWTEGLAEHWSGGQDARDEMVMRDLVLTGNLPRMQDLEFINSPIIYPIGGRVHEWLAEAYGDYRAALFYKEAWRFETFDAAMRGIYGRSAAELNEEFQVAMRRAYLPASQRLASSASLGTVLAGAAVKPALAADSAGEGRVVYFTAPGGYVEVVSRRLDGGGKQVLLRSGRTGSMAGFHPFESRLDASRPGLVLAGTRVEDRDALIVWDLKQRKVVGRYRFEGLISVVSPTWLPGDTSVVFSGLSFDGVSDLYRFTFEGERLERLTNDHYQDLDATASPDGRSIVFSSDRGPDGLQGAMNLYLLDLATRTVHPLTQGRWIDESPRWAPNGRIYFASSRDTVLNIFSIEVGGTVRRETSTWSGAYDPTWVPERDAILAGTFEGVSFNVTLFRPDTLARADSVAALALALPGPVDTVADTPWQWPASEASIAAARDPEQYKSKLAVDLAIGTAAYTPGRYTSPGLAVLLSDLLGDHVALITASTYISTDFEGAFDNLNVTGIYLDQSHRLNWGIGGFRSHGYVYEVNRTVDYLEKTVGGFGLLRYPMSRFKRAEALLSLEYSDRFDFTLPVDEPRRTGLIATQTLSYTFDNTAWTWTGPIDGFRLGLSGSLSTNLTGGRIDGWFLSGDWRGYLRTTRQSAYSIRTLGFYAGGERPRRINLGGSLGMRGFPWYGFVAGSRAFMVNNEFRFQLFDRLVFGLPITDITFPGIQTAFFADLGAASTPGSAEGPLLSSYGVSWRMAMGPFAVLRLDWGQLQVHGSPFRYGLGPDYQKSGFLAFFFGYNY